MKNKYTPLKLFILLAAFGLQPLASQEPIRISPGEAVQMAVRNNLGLQSARVSAETRRRESDLSWNQFIPSVNLAGMLNRTNAEPLPPMSGSRWQAIGTIQTSINLNLAMIENINRLRRDWETGLISYNKARMQLERDVRKAYNNMLLFQENASLLRESFQAAQRLVDFAQANFLAGRAPELPLLQAQVAMENMRPAVEQVEYAFWLSMVNFAMLLGLPSETFFELIHMEEGPGFHAARPEELPYGISDLISRAAASRPEIQELRHTILMLESARKMQQRALLPNLNLSWSYNPVHLDPWGASWSLSNWRDQGSFSITLGIRLHSLLPFSQDTQGIRNMDDQITAANIGLAQMIQGTEMEIFNTILSLDRIRRTAEAQAQTVALAERVFSLTEDAFRAGFQDFLQVQNAELELRQARVSLLEHQFNFLNGLLDLEYLTGVPFGTLSSQRVAP